MPKRSPDGKASKFLGSSDRTPNLPGRHGDRSKPQDGTEGTLASRSVSVTPEVAKLWEWFKDDLRDRQKYDSEWERYQNYYLSRHWRSRSKSGSERPASNFTFAAVELRVGLLVESQGKINIIPRRPQSGNDATYLQLLHDAVKDESGFFEARHMAIKNAAIFGVGAVKFDYDVGSGKILAHPVDPRNLVVSPGALDFNGASRIGYFRNIPLAVALQTWPELEGKVQPGVWEDVREIVTEPEPGSTDRPVRLFTVSGGPGGVGRSGKVVIVGAGDDKIVTYLQMFVRELDPETGRPRWVVYNVVNNVLVGGGAQPLPLNRVPMALYRIYKDTWTLWSPSVVQIIASIQAAANIRHASLLDWLDEIVRPTAIYPKNSGVEISVDPVTGWRTIKYNPSSGGTPPNISRPPDPPAALFEVLRLEQKMFDDILGNQDILQGRRPVGVQTGEAMKVLSENANARIRNEARNIATGDIEAAWIMMEMGAKFLKNRAIKLKREILDSPESLRSLFESGAIAPSGNFAIGLARDFDYDDFDIQIDTSFLTPMDRSDRAGQFTFLLQNGFIDLEDYLEGIDMPNRKKMIEKFKQRQEAQTQLEQKKLEIEARKASPDGSGQDMMQGVGGEAPASVETDLDEELARQELLR